VAPCPFCALAAGGVDDELVALRTPNAFVVPALVQRPLHRGHMLVLPASHVTRLIDVEAPLLQELYTVAARVSMAVRKAFGATGATLFQNDDAPDQILLHLHIHVVPRRPGDDFKLPDPVKAVLSREERRHQALALRRALE
jgi:histidine triad (HIT) family protein